MISKPHRDIKLDDCGKLIGEIDPNRLNPKTRVIMVVKGPKGSLLLLDECSYYHHSHRPWCYQSEMLKRFMEYNRETST